MIHVDGSMKNGEGKMHITVPIPPGKFCSKDRRTLMTCVGLKNEFRAHRSVNCPIRLVNETSGIRVFKIEWQHLCCLYSDDGVGNGARCVKDGVEVNAPSEDCDWPLNAVATATPVSNYTLSLTHWHTGSVDISPPHEEQFVRRTDPIIKMQVQPIIMKRLKKVDYGVK
ncbi:hypothetical protein C8R43DRAFT_1108170 [Mycena crocata]|nr:hypothetical protein C8R43DRAFT_1108170 [Mycena crocata]